MMSGSLTTHADTEYQVGAIVSSAARYDSILLLLFVIIRWHVSTGHYAHWMPTLIAVHTHSKHVQTLRWPMNRLLILQLFTSFNLNVEQKTGAKLENFFLLRLCVH